MVFFRPKALKVEQKAQQHLFMDLLTSYFLIFIGEATWRTRLILFFCKETRYDVCDVGELIFKLATTLARQPDL